MQLFFLRSYFLRFFLALLLLPILLYGNTIEKSKKERVYTIRLFSVSSISSAQEELKPLSQKYQKGTSLFRVGSYITAQYGKTSTHEVLKNDLSAFYSMGFSHAAIIPTTPFHLKTEYIVLSPTNTKELELLLSNHSLLNKKIKVEVNNTTSVALLSSANISDFFRHTLVNCILFFAYMSLITMITMFVHKIILEIKTNKLELLKNQYREILTLSLFDDDQQNMSLAPLTQPIEFKAFSDIVIELLETFNDPIYKAVLHHYLIHYGILQYYLSVASKTRSSNHRLDAVDRLAMTHYDKNQDFFLTLIDNPKTDDAVRQSAIIGLSFILNPEDCPLLLSILIHIDTSGKFSEFVLGNLIHRFIYLEKYEVIESTFHWLCVQNNPLSLKAFIEAIAVIGYRPIIPKIVSLYFTTSHTSLKITIVRTLGVLGEISEKELYRDALKSSNETLRIVASKSIAAYTSDDLTYSAALHLFDDSFYVRYNISRSLIHLPKGIDYLHDIASTSADIYAQQSALYAIRLMENLNV